MEFKIEVPIGYEIDKEKSTFEKIVFKKSVKELPKTWGELGEFKGFYITTNSLVSSIRSSSDAKGDACTFKTEEQAEASIALAQLSQLRDVYRDGWVPDWCTGYSKYVISFYRDGIDLETANKTCQFLSFKDRETRDLFFKNFKDLIEKAKPLMS